ncbi:tetratricopeptide repeat protein [Pseudopedobacter saltans]|uniref:tetratricopeptide repeat protein n=1 Tax=Pseudopedobacter saltans TaxID=151895 RepID=UPI0011D1C34D|nr:tetratricopeptide repeat protein [Pseudopedobacter saltans]
MNKIATDTSLLHLFIWGINTTADLAQIASKVLAAGIAMKEKNYGSSVSLLKEAVAMEDHLNYNEPPDWFFSVRYHLGAALIRDKKYSEAEKIYRQDLQIWKKNGWALIGLYNSLIIQHKNNAAQTVKSAFDQSWQYADIKIKSSSNIFN